MAGWGAIGSLAGCASHARSLEGVRQELMAGNLTAAVTTFEQRKPEPGDLLYRLEQGQMLRIGGRFEESNAAFEAAELLIEDLYTRSISREAVALLGSDKLLPYRGMPYEVQLVHYYRALNYLDLGQLDEALVEARKANFQLAAYAEKAPDDRAFRQDAFLQYFTGLLYEAAGESNDALVSFRSAAELYGRYENEYGLSAPAAFWEDYYSAAVRGGSSEEVRPLAEDNPELPANAARAAEHNVVFFLESGFVPFRETVDIWLPILERRQDERDDWIVADRYVTHYGDRIYAYRQPSELSHVLRFAFPRLVEVPPLVQRAEIVMAQDGEDSDLAGERAIDLAAVAKAEFDDRLPGILARTIVRALGKELARASSSRKSETLGAIVNVLGIVSEQADTRGWILLPGRIDVLQMKLPEGTHEVKVRFSTAGGSVIHDEPITLEVPALGTVFRAVRCYR